MPLGQNKMYAVLKTVVGIQIVAFSLKFHWHLFPSASPSAFNTLRSRQDGRHFANDFFERIFLNENVLISINILLKFIPKAPIDNIPTLAQIVACRLIVAKPLSEPTLVYWSGLLTHICVTPPQWVIYNLKAIAVEILMKVITTLQITHIKATSPKGRVNQLKHFWE